MISRRNRSSIFLIIIFSVSTQQMPYEAMISFVTRGTDVESEPVFTCLSGILTRYFRVRSTVAVTILSKPTISVSVLKDDSLLQRLHQKSLWSVVNLDKDCLRFYLYRGHAYKSYVMVGESNNIVMHGAVDDIVAFLGTCDFWILNGESSRFVVALEESADEANGLESVQRILAASWKSGQQNVIVLRSQVQTVEIFSWFPLHMDSARPVILDIFANGEFRYDSNLFPDKVSGDLKGLKIRFGVIINPPFMCKTADGRLSGLEEKIVRTLEELLNFKPVYHFTGGGGASFSGNMWEDALNSVHAGVTDVAVGGFYEDSQRFQRLEHTVTYMKDPVRWHVTGDWVSPRATGVSVAVAVCNGVTSLLFMLLMTLFAYTRRTAKKKRVDTAWMLVVSLVSETSYIIRYLGRRQKFLWAFMAFYILIINTIGKSVLSTRLSTRSMIPTITTVHELLESDLPLLHGFPTSPELAFPDETVNTSTVDSRTIHCLRLTCLDLSLVRRPLALTAKQSVVDLMEKLAPTPKPIFHSLDKSVADLQITSYTRKNYFLLPTFRRYMRAFVEAGLVEYWQSQVRHNPNCDMSLTDLKGFYSDRKRITKFFENLESREKLLKFLGPEGPFQGLIQGYSLSFLVFVFEVMKSYRVVHRLVSNLKIFLRKKRIRRRDILRKPRHKTTAVLERPAESLPDSSLFVRYNHEWVD